MKQDDSLHFSVMEVDIERYSDRRSNSQIDLRRSLRESFAEACERARVPLAEPARDDGDGLRAIFSAQVSPSHLVADLCRELDHALARRNQYRTPLGTLRLRLALGGGFLRPEGGDWVGAALITTARILNANAGRALLRLTPAANLVVLLSESMYTDVVMEEEREVDPSKFTRFEIGSGEKGSGIAAWASLWGREQLRPSSEAMQAANASTHSAEMPPSTPEDEPGEEGHAPGREKAPAGRGDWINYGTAGFGDSAIVVGNNNGNITRGGR